MANKNNFVNANNGWCLLGLFVLVYICYVYVLPLLKNLFGIKEKFSLDGEFDDMRNDVESAGQDMYNDGESAGQDMYNVGKSAGQDMDNVGNNISNYVDPQSNNNPVVLSNMPNVSSQQPHTQQPQGASENILQQGPSNNNNAKTSNFAMSCDCKPVKLT